MNDMQGLFARFGVSLLCGKANIVPMGLKRSFTGLLASRADIHERPSRLLALNPLPGLGQKPSWRGLPEQTLSLSVSIFWLAGAIGWRSNVKVTDPPRRIGRVRGLRP